MLEGLMQECQGASRCYVEHHLVERRFDERHL